MRKLVLLVIAAVVTTPILSASAVAAEIKFQCAEVNTPNRAISGKRGWLLDKEKKTLFRTYNNKKTSDEYTFIRDDEEKWGGVWFYSISENSTVTVVAIRKDALVQVWGMSPDDTFVKSSSSYSSIYRCNQKNLW